MLFDDRVDRAISFRAAVWSNSAMARGLGSLPLVRAVPILHAASRDELSGIGVKNDGQVVDIV